MDIRQMRVFRAVMAAGTTSAAADRLNVSQPAISKTIKLIEDSIQMTLFERTGGKLRPTLEAIALLPEINRVLSSHETIRQRIDEIRSGQRGLIKIAAAAMAASGLLPGTIALFRKKHPDIDFSINTATTKEVIRMVAEDKVDFGICQRGHGYPAISSRTISNATVVCAMKADHPLAQLSEVTAHDLIAYPIIANDFNEPVLGSRIAASFTQEGLYPSISMWSNLSITSFALVRAGLGVALGDSYTLPTEGVVIRPYKPDIDLQIHAIFPLDQPPSMIVNSFCEELSEFAANLHNVS